MAAVVEIARSTSLDLVIGIEIVESALDLLASHAPFIVIVAVALEVSRAPFLAHQTLQTSEDDIKGSVEGIVRSERIARVLGVQKVVQIAVVSDLTHVLAAVVFGRGVT